MSSGVDGTCSSADNAVAAVNQPSLCSTTIHTVSQTRTATCSRRTRKRAFHFCLPGVVRRIHAAALLLLPLLLLLPPRPTMLLRLMLMLLCIANLQIKS